MNNPKNIRHFSIISESGHGGKSFSDFLVGRKEISVHNGSRGAHFCCRCDDRRYSINYANIVPLLHEDCDQRFLMNYFDISRRENSLTSNVISTLRAIDGALVIIDSNIGLADVTETLLINALVERVKPVLVLNSIDLAISELNLTKEEIYKSFLNTIESVNKVIQNYTHESLGDWQVYPEVGNVAFAICLKLCGFTLKNFAALYADKFGLDPDKLAKMLWGNNFFNPSTKKWTTKSTTDEGLPLERGFCMFVLDPIFRLFDAILNDKVEEYEIMLEKLNIELTEDQKEYKGERLLRVVMCKFMPLDDNVSEMITIHLPSPLSAQKYRCEILYRGPLDDECALAIKNCDPSGPLTVYVYRKVISLNNDNQYYAIGRILSGTIKSGMSVRILGPAYAPGSDNYVFFKKIENTFIMGRRYERPIDFSSVAGNIVGLPSIHQYLQNTGTITTCETAYNCNTVSFSPTLTVEIDIYADTKALWKQVIEKLKLITTENASASYTVTQPGKATLICNDEHNLQIHVQDLESQLDKKITFSEPFISYRGAVLSESSINHHFKEDELQISEPIYIVGITCSEIALNAVAEVLETRNGEIICKKQRPGIPVFTIKAYLAASKSFGLTAELKGKAFVSYVFDHWRIIPGSPLDPTSPAGVITKAIRKRKGLPELDL